MTLHTLIALLIKVYPKWEGYKKKNPPYQLIGNAAFQITGNAQQTTDGGTEQ